MPGVQAVIDRHEPVVTADVKGRSGEACAWRQALVPAQEAFIGGIRSWLGVALRARERLVGVLHLAHGTPDYFTPRHAQLALTFANQVAVAMENAQLYAQAQELAVAHERERLARDLHDAVSQTLFSASMIAEVLPRLWQANPEQAFESVREMGELTRGAQAEMRTLQCELRPDALLQTSLGELLRQLGVAIGTQGRMRVAVAVEGGRALPPDVQLGLYRIAQEALNNVRKHAHASSVEVCLRFGAGQDGQAGPVELSVVDDGCSFDPQSASQKGLGLGNLPQQAKAIGASFASHTAVTSVPAPGRLSIASAASMLAARSVMMLSPNWLPGTCSGSKPPPSSSMHNSTCLDDPPHPGAQFRRTVAVRA